MRFTISSVVSLTAAGVPFLLVSAASCGSCDDDDLRALTYPVEGSTFDVPAREKDVAPQPDVVEEPTVEAGACTPAVGAPVEVVKIPEDPNAFGGLIPDGTYVMTKGLYADGSDGGVAFKRAAQLVFSGKNVTWHFDTDSQGKPAPTCCEGTWAYNATEVMQMNLTCNGEPVVASEYYDYFPNGMPDGGSTAPQIMIHVSAELHDIYTKK